MEAELNFWLQFEFQIRDYLKNNNVSLQDKREYSRLLTEIDEILEWVSGSK
jgi:hypothetical protein